MTLAYPLENNPGAAMTRRRPASCLILLDPAAYPACCSLTGGWVAEDAFNCRLNADTLTCVRREARDSLTIASARDDKLTADKHQGATEGRESSYEVAHTTLLQLLSSWSIAYFRESQDKTQAPTSSQWTTSVSDVARRPRAARCVLRATCCC